jgi:hypothetical protein
MESNLTKEIKKRLRNFRPLMPSAMRTVRWAEEVTTATGIVDVIRFEDYKAEDNSYCNYTESSLGKMRGGACKVKGRVFKSPGCHGCVFKKNSYVIDILVTCYEVKVSVSDFRSKHGHNFHGHRNYYAVPAEIAGKVIGLIDDDIGLIAYYPKSGSMTVKKECVQREMADAALISLMYNAFKKWVDGKQETSHS